MLRLIGAAALMAVATSPALAQGRSGDRPPGQDRNQNAKALSVDAAPGQDRRQGGSDGRDDADRRNAKPTHANPAERGPFNDRRLEEADWRRDELRNQTTQQRNDRDGRADTRNGSGNWDQRDRIYAAVPACPPGLARKNPRCLPPGIARNARDEAFGFAYRPALFGISLRADADYVYYDGYLIPASGQGSRYIPLLGGALAIGQAWPESYPSLSLTDWQHDYYGFDDPDTYRYADNVLYRVDPATAAIEAVVALLSGTDFTVGEALPAGYDIYNIPAPYQDRYTDSDDAMYRYDDGRVYEVDPVSMLIERAIDVVV